VIDPSQPVTSLYSWVTPVNIDPIDPSQPVTLQIPQAAPNKRVHNEAHGLLSDIDNNGVLININAVLIDIDTVLIDIDGVLIDIDTVLIDIDGVLIDIDSVLIDIDTVLIDINVHPLTIITTVESKTANPDHFFSQPFEHIGANGKVKKHPGWGDQLLETDEDNFDSDFVN
jgi:hypothetical protein